MAYQLRPLVVYAYECKDFEYMCRKFKHKVFKDGFLTRLRIRNMCLTRTQLKRFKRHRNKSIAKMKEMKRRRWEEKHGRK